MVRLDLPPQVGHGEYGIDGWLRFRYTLTMCIAIQRERESESEQERRLYPQEERIDPRLCQF